MTERKLEGPAIDFAGLSPLIALLAGAVVVLMVGLLRSRTAREHGVPFLSFATLATSLGLTIWQLDTTKSLVAGALEIDGLGTVLNILFVSAGMATVLLSWRALAPRESAHGEFHALLLTSIAGMLVLAWSTNLVTGLPRARAAVDPALRAVRDRDAQGDLARVGPEVPHRRLARFGGLPLRPRADLRRHGVDGLRRHRGRQRRRNLATDP
jgi:hypothetical protein